MEKAKGIFKGIYGVKPFFFFFSSPTQLFLQVLADIQRSTLHILVPSSSIEMNFILKSFWGQKCFSPLNCYADI